MPRDSEYIYLYTHKTLVVLPKTPPYHRPSVWPGRILQPPGEAPFEQQVTRRGKLSSQQRRQPLLSSLARRSSKQKVKIQTAGERKKNKNE